jgi:hypothetical protein
MTRLATLSLQKARSCGPVKRRCAGARYSGQMHAAALLVPFSFAFLIGATVPSAAAGTCSTDTFTIDGSAVTLDMCLGAAPDPAASRHGSPAKAPAATLTETFTVKGQPPLVRALPLDALPADEPSRTIDDVPLEKLGLARTLHLTIAVRSSGVHLEHALLVPGALTLK